MQEIRKNKFSSPKLEALKKKKSATKKKKLSIFLVGISILFVGFVFLSRIEKWNINNIEITGNNIVDTSLIASAVESNLKGAYIWFIPKTNILLYPKESITANLEKSFSRLKNISIQTKSSQTIGVSVEERNAKYTWCGEIPPSQKDLSPQNDLCYFMDTEGYVFDSAPYFSGNVFFRFYGKTDGVPPGVFFEKENFLKIIFYKETLENLGLKPIAFYIKSKEEGSIFLESAKNLLGAEVLVKIETDQNQLMENIQAALNTKVFKDKILNEYDKLEYIDLRFENKVYYKFHE